MIDIETEMALFRAEMESKHNTPISCRTQGPQWILCCLGC